MHWRSKMANLGIARVRESTYVTTCMLILNCAGVLSWIFLMAGTAAVEALRRGAVLGSRGLGIALDVDVGFSWWLLVYTGTLYVATLLVWIMSMKKGLSVFVIFSQPLAFLFGVAFAWAGVDLQYARLVTGTSSQVDAWFTGLLFTAFTVLGFMLFFASWRDILTMKASSAGQVSAEPKYPEGQAGAPAYVEAQAAPAAAPQGPPAAVMYHTPASYAADPHHNPATAYVAQMHQPPAEP
eukprot:jgi/Ulvmu1/12602/UM092_0032.1